MLCTVTSLSLTHTSSCAWHWLKSLWCLHASHVLITKTQACLSYPLDLKTENLGLVGVAFLIRSDREMRFNFKSDLFFKCTMALNCDPVEAYSWQHATYTHWFCDCSAAWGFCSQFTAGCCVCACTCVCMCVCMWQGGKSLTVCLTDCEFVNRDPPSLQVYIVCHVLLYVLQYHKIKISLKQSVIINSAKIQRFSSTFANQEPWNEANVNPVCCGPSFLPHLQRELWLLYRTTKINNYSDTLSKQIFLLHVVIFTMSITHDIVLITELYWSINSYIHALTYFACRYKKKKWAWLRYSCFKSSFLLHLWLQCLDGALFQVSIQSTFTI